MSLLSKNKQYKLLIFGLSSFTLFHFSQCAFEEIELTPPNTNGVYLGEFSLAQLVVFMIAFVKLILLYAVGVAPVEFDLGWFFGTGSGALFPRKFGGSEINLMKIAYDCPLQYVCELDIWANSGNHEYYLEKLIASWFKNPDSRYNNTKSAEFGGAGTCKEMHPCPFDIQDIVGIHLPESEHNIAKFITDNEVDMHLDLMS